MAAPRKPTVDECPICNRDVSGLGFDARREIAEHRQEHAQLDRRRAAYRRYNRRYRRRNSPDLVGWLHDVGCPGRHQGRFSGCTPIPCYRVPVEQSA